MKQELTILNFKLTTDEYVEALTRTLTQYQDVLGNVLFAHWHVTGGDFFDLHELFDELYTKGIEHVDQIAERLRAMAKIAPIAASDTQKLKKVFQDGNDASRMAMEVLTLLAALAEQQRGLITQAEGVQDYATAEVLRAQIQYLEKKVWMLREFLSA